MFRNNFISKIKDSTNIPCIQPCYCNKPGSVRASRPSPTSWPLCIEHFHHLSSTPSYKEGSMITSQALYPLDIHVKARNSVGLAKAAKRNTSYNCVRCAIFRQLGEATKTPTMRLSLRDFDTTGLWYHLKEVRASLNCLLEANNWQANDGFYLTVSCGVFMSRWSSAQPA